MATRKAPSRRERKRAENVSLVHEAIARWRLQYDPADDDGPLLSEFIVAVLEQEGRLR